jgi:hypothetical protein
MIQPDKLPMNWMQVADKLAVVRASGGQVPYRELPVKPQGLVSDPKLPGILYTDPHTTLAMSTPNYQDLIYEEQILHHHAATIKKDLEAYHAYSSSRTEENWKDLFKKHLARFIFYNIKPFSYSFRRYR